MKTPLYLLAIALILSVSSCKKEKEAYDPSGALTAVVKSVTHSNTGTTDSYTYDAGGRIQLIQSSNGTKTVFEYADTTLTQTNYEKGEVVVSVTRFALDAQGLVSNSVVTDANGAVVSYHTYTFDDQKQMTAQNNYTANHEVNGKLEWVWGGGNMWNYAVYDSAITHTLCNSYLWYYDPATTSVGNANTGKKFFGADSKYLTRKIVGYVWGAANTLSTFEYTLDSEQRLAEIRTYDYNGILKNTDSYTYY